VRARQFELADGALLALAAVVVHDSRVDVHPGDPDAVGLLARPVVGHREVVRPALREPVPLREVDAPVPPRLHDALPARATAGLREPERREVRRLPAVRRRHHAEDRRDRHQDRRVVLVDDPEHVLGVELARDDDLRPEVEQRNGEDVPAARVEHREHHRRHVLRAQPPRRDRVERVPRDAAVREHGLLRRPRRPASVQEEVRVVQPEVRAIERRRVVGHRLVERVVLRVAEPQHGAVVVAGVVRQRRGDVVVERALDDDQRRRDVSEQVGELALGEPVTERREHAPGLPRREEQVDERRAVPGDDRDPAADRCLPDLVRTPHFITDRVRSGSRFGRRPVRTDAARVEQSRRRVRPLVELAVRERLARRRVTQPDRVRRQAPAARAPVPNPVVRPGPVPVDRHAATSPAAADARSTCSRTSSVTASGSSTKNRCEPPS